MENYNQQLDNDTNLYMTDNNFSTESLDQQLINYDPTISPNDCDLVSPQFNVQGRLSRSSNAFSVNFYDSPAEDSPLLHVGDVQIEDGIGAVPPGLDHCHTVKTNKKSWHAATRLLIACGLTSCFLVAEAVGGYLANSISIMSDAAHLLSDLTSFIVSLIAIYLSMRPASIKMSYGYQRAEVLGAVISVLIIWLITGILVYIAAQRVITMDFEIEADLMIIVAAIGVAINLILGFVLNSGGNDHGHSHGFQSSSANHSHSGNVNIRAALIHVLGDLIQSVGVLLAAYIIKYVPEWKIADPICTFIFSIIVMATTIPILKDLAIVLMEGTPPGVEYATVVSNLKAIPGVVLVHSLHVWALTLDKNACSVHLAIGTGVDTESVLQDAQRVIRYRHSIYQTTIQVENYQPQLMDNCQQCQPLSC